MIYPKVRPLETQWAELKGQRMLILRDRLGLTEQAAIVPPTVAVLLSLCDGSRDLAALRVAFELRTGMPLSLERVEGIISQLDEALLLDSPRLRQARAQALESFRAQPHREPTLAGSGYPADPDQARAMLEALVEATGSIENRVPQATLRGLITPHIDYQRGGLAYARVWEQCRQAIGDVERVIILGTDHAGSAGRLTPTRQSYATPLGVVPTDVAVVEALAGSMGSDLAFEEELHHRREHSIELTMLWLQYALRQRDYKLVPVLCGSFQPFVAGADPAADAALEAAVGVLRQAVAEKPTLVVAAADLAHVGPAFGDGHPFGEGERADLASFDAALLDAACSVDASAWLETVRKEGDRWRVCGLPPVYIALRLLEGASGQLVDYAQCPADAAEASWVSIAGVVFG